MPSVDCGSSINEYKIIIVLLFNSLTSAAINYSLAIAILLFFNVQRCFILPADGRFIRFFYVRTRYPVYHGKVIDNVICSSSE